MITRVIYDLSGVPIDQKQGSNLYTPNGLPYLDIEIPEGKELERIDVTATPNEPVYRDRPKTEIQIMQSNMLSIEGALFTALSQIDEMNGGV